MRKYFVFHGENKVFYSINMEEIIKKIKEEIESCKQEGNMFCLPVLPDDICVTKTDVGSHGSTLYHDEYHITSQDGKMIEVDYQSKDKCKSFVVRPDRSYIKVKCSDSTYDFSDAWDEKS